MRNYFHLHKIISLHIIERHCNIWIKMLHFDTAIHTQVKKHNLFFFNLNDFLNCPLNHILVVSVLCICLKQELTCKELQQQARKKITQNCTWAFGHLGSWQIKVDPCEQLHWQLSPLHWVYFHRCTLQYSHMLQFRRHSQASCALTCRLTWLFTSSGHLGLTSKHAASSPLLHASPLFSPHLPSSSRPLLRARSTPSTQPQCC